VLLTASGLQKRFGATQALRAAALELRAGEVLSVMGENGSGKSTLVKILAGVHRPDAGTIELASHGRLDVRTPRASLAAGIVTVFQEVLTIPGRSVVENIWLGSEGLFRAPMSARERRERAYDVLANLLRTVPDLDTPIGRLSLSDCQACAIARALVRPSRVLIFDEATSALDVETRDRLFAQLRVATARGAGVLFISHRMDEVEEISDRVTVMRSGESVGTMLRGEASSQELVRMMTGAERLVSVTRERPPATRPEAAPPALEARGLRIRPGAGAIDFSIRPGELVGLAGLEGHGQDPFLRALAGLLAVAEGTVVRRQGDEEAVIDGPRAAARNGIAYLPRQRRAEALFETLSIRENFALPTLSRDARFGLWRHGASDVRLARYTDRLKIVLDRAGAAISTLSGGNQQKVILARWLAAEPSVLLLNDPTRGIDLGAKQDLYGLLRSLADDGLAMVMLSTEVDEHLELMDRVVVFRNQEIAAELDRSVLSRRQLIGSFFGERGDHV
jgi:ABC-type sugar transport system ATPase subunit